MQQQYTTPNSRTADKFVVRLPDGLRADIAVLAEDNDRSMNSEIVNRLKRSITQDQLNEEQTKLIGMLLQRITELEEKLQSDTEAA
ncbi:Arc family DNA-binding protein [Pseudomonas monteilii]|uniref:Arc family DNA-binding protein n=1 Tax=Pseudomonas TaxID=286 RepID=UPI000EFA9DE9|nr:MULTISPECIES: Arc family DNA-binding protein [Pseudomonas]AYO02547.1 Arc family DNA-binding protein [Pseudomonas sp. LTGT-11-2Z]MCE0927877.1 Arc family DNA-binding protein [Pseudomonas monteilii]MCT8188290.1 Arc family DNA-binding protein [Pseudomonas monteilii]UPK83794.1 Arc family DNA-binding protein [Pseudomonas sp. A2]WJN88622.1 Arc family DNA-binding protein [Pseudomonas monteilii]